MDTLRVVSLMRALLLALGLSAMSCSESRFFAPVVQGVVTDIRTGQPVIGARILLVDAYSIAPTPHVTATDDRGFYRFERVEPGTYAVFLYHDHLVLFDRTASLVRVERGSFMTHDMRLLDSELWDGRGYRVAGVVRNAKSGDPIEGAFAEPGVWAYGGVDVFAPFLGVTLPEWAATDQHGRFSITNPVVTDFRGDPLGLFPITVFRQGYEPYTLVGRGPSMPTIGALLPLPKDSVLTVAIDLTPESAPGPGAVRGRVLELGSGRPVRVWVALSILAAADPDTLPDRGPAGVPVQGKVVVTNAEGRFLIGGLHPGEYVLSPGYLDGDGYSPQYDAPVATITDMDSAAVDIGDVFVLRAIEPIFPEDGTSIMPHSPQLSWEPFPDGPEYEVVGYKVSDARRYPLDTTTELLSEPHWQAPAFPAGSFVRWIVDAFAVVGNDPDTVVIGTFEHVATFTVDR